MKGNTLCNSKRHEHLLKYPFAESCIILQSYEDITVLNESKSIRLRRPLTITSQIIAQLHFLKQTQKIYISFPVLYIYLYVFVYVYLCVHLNHTRQEYYKIHTSMPMYSISNSCSIANTYSIVIRY